MKKEKFIKGDYPLVKKWRTTGMASSYVWIVIVSPSQKWERMIEEDIKADGFISSSIILSHFCDGETMGKNDRRRYKS